MKVESQITLDNGRQITLDADDRIQCAGIMQGYSAQEMRVGYIVEVDGAYHKVTAVSSEEVE